MGPTSVCVRQNYRSLRMTDRRRDVSVVGMNGIQLLGRTTGARIAMVGLGIGIVGLLIQWIADPARFGGFPPGIIIVAVFGVLVVLTRKWWWSPLLATLISLFIVGLGVGPLIDNLRADNAGLVVGSAVMAVGLYGAAIAGIVAAVQGFRHRYVKGLGTVPPAA